MKAEQINLSLLVMPLNTAARRRCFHLADRGIARKWNRVKVKGSERKETTKGYERKEKTRVHGISTGKRNPRKAKRDLICKIIVGSNKRKIIISGRKSLLGTILNI